MTIAARNAYVQNPVYMEQGGRRLRVKTKGGVASDLGTGIIGSEDELWGDCPLLSYFLDQSIGVLYDEPFVNYDTSDWTLTQATAGSAAISTTIPGALTLNAGDTTAHHGAQIQRKVTAFLPAANKSVWYEWTVQAHFLTGELFIGLAAVDTTIIASGAMSTQNRIGWTSVTGDGVLLFDCDKGGVSTQIAAATLAVDTNIALGFFYDGVADTIQQYINGVAVGTPIATANISKSVMYPSFVCQNESTDQETLTASGGRIFQLR